MDDLNPDLELDEVVADMEYKVAKRFYDEVFERVSDHDFLESAFGLAAVMGVVLKDWKDRADAAR